MSIETAKYLLALCKANHIETLGELRDFKKQNDSNETLLNALVDTYKINQYAK